MRKSILLRRIILLLLSAVMLSGILSAVIYILVTQRMYVQMRADELTSIARTVAEMMTDSQQNGDYDRGLWPLLDRENKNFLGASLHIYNSQGKSIMNPPPDSKMGDRGKNPPQGDFMDEDLMPMISDDLKALLSGSEISEVLKFPNGQSYLMVGVPIKNGDSAQGAVIFTKSMSELSATMYGLNITLFVSTLAAFLIMLIPGYFATKRLVVPIRQMRDVAHAMAKGDFSVRADETQKGEIGELGRSMNHFAEESERLEHTRRDYVANVSHELRTPIAAIRAMGETLRDGMTKTEEKKSLFYNNIVRESMRLSRLVDDMLELSRLQSGTEAMQKSSFDLREVIQNAADVYSHVAVEAGIEFLLPVDLEEAMAVFSNPDRIEQVLIILLDNAIKHTPAGGSVTLLMSGKSNHVELCVSNTGEGIPEEDLPYIFERFYKADKSHSGGGSGLGLSIAKEIIKGLGENIRAESGRNGTRFVFSVGKS